MSQSPPKSNHRQNRVICIPCDLKKHQNIYEDAEKYRVFLDKFIEESPELFPKEINQGYLIDIIPIKKYNTIHP